MDKQFKTAVILCSCSGIVSERINWQGVIPLLSGHPSGPVFRIDELACGVDNLALLSTWLQEEAPDRVVVAACSPREHELTFRNLLDSAGINPFLLQLVNVREQVAWVTADPAKATLKAARLLSAALSRAMLQEPLSEKSIPVRTDVVVVGAGPAGMQATLTMARAGRKVTLVEKEPFIGGLPVRFEELFPNFDCGPCLLEPLMGEILHGPDSERITLLTLSEITGVTGSFGNWNLTIRRESRYVRSDVCIGCMACSAACPALRENRWNGGGQLAAVDVPFTGALPNLPHVDASVCKRLTGEECRTCLDECPLEGALDFEETPQEIKVEAGAVILATGAVERQDLPLKFMDLADIHTAYSFERLLAMNGPTGGEIRKSDGTTPCSLAIVHCAGSLDAETPYCSGICCRSAIKYAYLSALKDDAIVVTRLVREQVVPGGDGVRMLGNDRSSVVRYASADDLQVKMTPNGRQIAVASCGTEVPADLIVLCRPILPGAGTKSAVEMFELACDNFGFVAPLHPVANSCATSLKGVYLAGSCRGAGDIREAFTTGTAAAGFALSDLVEGRNLALDPQAASVDGTICAGCRTCLTICPYKAIVWQEADRVATVSEILCRGCGTCAASCPSGAIKACGFSRDMLREEIKGGLR